MFVRTDLPLADQMVQGAHVCLEAGQRFAIPGGTCVVLLQVENEAALQEAMGYCRRRDIPTHVFIEPDGTDALPHVPMGMTAACTPPLASMQRRHLRRFPLWSRK